jgi:hypothetical protein
MTEIMEATGNLLLMEVYIIAHDPVPQHFNLLSIAKGRCIERHSTAVNCVISIGKG